MSYYPPQQRTGSIGCLGVLSFLCMSIFSLLNAGLVWFADPNWAEPVAFWKGKLIEPEPAFVSIGELPADEQPDWWLAPMPPLPEVRPEAKWVLFEPGRAAVAYEPSRGAAIDLPLDGRLTLPAGAIREACEVSMTPAMEIPPSIAQAQIVSCVYDLKIGRHKSYQFVKPVSLTLPYRPGIVPADQIKMAVWQDGKMETVPTTVDEAGLLVTGQLPHASPVAVVGVAVIPAGALFAGSLTAREMFWSTYMANSRSYETENFKINFYNEGEWVMSTENYGVTPDAQYRQLNGRKPRADGVPWWVVDVAVWLEEARSDFEKAGIKCPTPVKIRGHTVGLKHRVYLTPFPQKEYGKSRLGGPIFLNNELPRLDGLDVAGSGGAIRHTVVHELYHVAQGEHYGLRHAVSGEWWLELSAAYIGDWYWENRSNRADHVARFYLKDREKVSWKPMNTTGDPEHYAYASFLQAIDRKIPGGGLKLVQAVNAAGATSLAEISDAARSSVGMSLADLFALYATDIYHDDLWSGRLAPTMNTSSQQCLQAYMISAAPRAFVAARARPINSSAPALANDHFGCDIGPLRPLTAKAFPILIEDLPAKRKGRLVVSMKGGGSPVDLQILVAEDRFGKSSLPLRSGKPTPMTSFPVAAERLQKIYRVGGTDADRITLLAINRNLSAEVNGPTIERWLLLAPAFCNWERYADKPRTWKVTWHRAELRDYSDIFNGYEVWGRKIGDPPDKLVRLTGTTDEFYDFNAPDDDDYVFAVRVQDKHLNHGEFSDQDQTDPFAGEWSGRVRLVGGSVAEPLIKWMQSDLEKGRQQQLARIGALPPAEQADARQQLEKSSQEQKEFNDMIAGVLRKAEGVVARIGVPVKFRIARSRGQYTLVLTNLFWQELKAGDVEPIALKRASGTQLRLLAPPPDMPPITLDLVREGPSEIRSLKPWHVESKVENEPAAFDLTWSFTREK